MPVLLLTKALQIKQSFSELTLSPLSLAVLGSNPGPHTFQESMFPNLKIDFFFFYKIIYTMYLSRIPAVPVEVTEAVTSFRACIAEVTDACELPCGSQ